MATTTQGTLSPPVQAHFAGKLLSIQRPDHIHKIAAKEEVFPANSGTTIRYRRYDLLDTAKVPLNEVTTEIPPSDLTATNIDATISFYGKYLRISEQVTLQAQDPILNQSAELLGQSMRQTQDELTRDMLASTASFINCTNGVNGDRPTEIGQADVDGVIAALAHNDARTISAELEGSEKFGTSPIRNAYFAMGNTRLIPDLENVQNFVSPVQYGSNGDVLQSEWGAVKNIRFLLSSIGSVSARSSRRGNDVLNVFVAGMESYGCVYQDRYSTQFLYQAPQYTGDPLMRFANVGYKMGEVPMLFNDEWVLNMRCTETQ